ncbi:hypothetical protein [Acinetobacter baumannii]|uniref:hypothetical protein n=1 Tax=Acinetobacter baumannii TaxID=470 RepID=UPI002340EDC5|nr:hypothetical protein [Acinetobacter baumannii]MDC4151729.1 hypothetical protein [Acinetobacter baumannii]
MSCSCKKDFQERFLDRAKEMFPDSTNHEVEIENYAFVFNKDNSMELRGYQPVVISHTATVKKTGLQKVKKEKTSLLFSYCPFCGVKFEKPEVDES